MSDPLGFALCMGIFLVYLAGFLGMLIAAHKGSDW